MSQKTLAKRSLPLMLLLVLGLTLSLATAAWAGPRWGHGCNLTPEQAGKAFDLRQKFMNDTASLRKGMAVKRAELRALWQAENPDEKAIVAKQKELSALKEQFQSKAVPFRLEMRKIVPQTQVGAGPMGPGDGRGAGMGNGPGRGRGMARGMGHGMGLGMDGGFGPAYGW
ncbi:MAG: periplasmic heavy metal sensor [Thermodesulfobacteriota bacterium]